MKAALKALRERQKAPEFRDFRDAPPSRDEVLRFYGPLGDRLLNRASTTWRGLSEAERAADPVDLMVSYPALIKRPVIESGARITCGWTPDVQALWFD